MLSSDELVKIQACFTTQQQREILHLYSKYDESAKSCISQILDIACNRINSISLEQQGNKTHKRAKSVWGTSSNTDNNLVKYGKVLNVSVGAPIRKKVDLFLFENALHFVSTGVNTDDVDYSSKVLLRYDLNDIKHVVTIDTPEKTKKQTSIVLVHKNSNKTCVLNILEDANVEFVLSETSWLENVQLDNVTSLQLLIIMFEVLFKTKAETAFKIFKCHNNKAKEGFFSVLNGTSAGYMFGFNKPITYIPLKQLEEVNVERLGKGCEIHMTIKKNQRNNDCLDLNGKYEFRVLDLRGDEYSIGIEELIRKWKMYCKKVTSNKGDNIDSNTQSCKELGSKSNSNSGSDDESGEEYTSENDSDYAPSGSEASCNEDYTEDSDVSESESEDEGSESRSGNISDAGEDNQ